jgi:hypothetical protein
MFKKKKLIINKIFFKNYINYNLKNFNNKQFEVLKKKNLFNLTNFLLLPKNYIFSYNLKNLLLEPYLLNKILIIKKNNKNFNFLVKKEYLYYNINMFFSTRKYIIKKIIKLKKK